MERRFYPNENAEYREARDALTDAEDALRAQVESVAAELGPPPARRIKLVPRGQAHDLTEIARELLSAELGARLAPLERVPRVTWGRRGPRRVRRSLQLGSYDPELGLVRIHPVLDQPAVPRFFVRYVLFHELLHAAFEDDPHGSRPHGASFRRREAAYPDYERALAWQELHLARLIRSARTGRPLRGKPAPARSRQGWLFPEAGGGG